MSTIDHQALSVIVFMYAMFEFFLKRLWGKARDQATPLKNIIRESLAMFAVMVLGTIIYLTLQLFLALAVLTLVYGLYDFIGSRKPAEQTRKTSLERFIIKEFLIGVFVYLMWHFASPFKVGEWYISLDQLLTLQADPIYAWLKKELVHIMVLGTAYVFMFDGGTKIIRGVLDKFPKLDKENKPGNNNNTTMEAENAGEWIGILERIITLSFVLTGSFTAIAFALTAKSIARFKELDSKNFAEYYLLGTSASIAVALLVGIIVKLILDL